MKEKRVMVFLTQKQMFGILIAKSASRAMLIMTFYFPFLMSSCNQEEIVENQTTKEQYIQTRAVTPDFFDWEVADTMPTPRYQSRIYMPWDGPGSLATTYKPDVLYDFKKKDGWTLLYNSFTSKTSAPLVNPYFILYNKYSGLLRIYLYTTTQFIATSSSLESTVTVNRSGLSILNFLGGDITNGAKRKDSYTQILPAPFDGGRPLAANKWYMMQYEMAYDPNVKNLTNINMNFTITYYDVESFKFDGEAKGSINGTIGLRSSSPNLSHALQTVGEASGTALLSGIGVDFINHHSKGSDGSNDLGLGKKVFSMISSGVSNALSNATKGLPGAAIGILSGILGGKGSSKQTVNLNFNLDQIKLKGTGTNSGSFPSMPITIKIPGMKNMSTSQGIVPLYNTPLGIFNYVGIPDFIVRVVTWKRYRFDDPWCPGQQITETNSTVCLPQTEQLDQYLVINPAVLEIANVDVKYDIIAKHKDGTYEINPEGYSSYDSGEHGTSYTPLPHPKFYLQYTVTVTPKNGDNGCIIYKTFELNDIWRETVTWKDTIYPE